MDFHDFVLEKLRQTYGDGSYRISEIRVRVEFQDTQDELTMRMSPELDGEFEPRVLTILVFGGDRLRACAYLTLSLILVRKEVTNDDSKIRGRTPWCFTRLRVQPD